MNTRVGILTKMVARERAVQCTTFKRQRERERAAPFELPFKAFPSADTFFWNNTISYSWCTVHVENECTLWGDIGCFVFYFKYAIFVVVVIVFIQPHTLTSNKITTDNYNNNKITGSNDWYIYLLIEIVKERGRFIQMTENYENYKILNDNLRIHQLIVHKNR